MKYPIIREQYIIDVGYEGPTDVCLVLTNTMTRRTKEFVIDSLPWKLLGKATVLPLVVFDLIMDTETENDELWGRD